MLLKAVGPEDLAEISEVVAKVWCPRVDGLPRGQHVGLIEQAGGLMRYLALHFQKESQRPPEGWRGHRLTFSRGYLAMPASEAREQARDGLRFKRVLRELLAEDELAELDGEAVEAFARAVHAERAELAWELVREQAVPTAFDADSQPTAWEHVLTPVRS